MEVRQVIVVRCLPLSLIRPLAANEIYYSPYTGETWARLDRGFPRWIASAHAAEGEKPYAFTVPPGTLARLPEQIDEIPPEFLKREWSLWTSAIASGIMNNSETDMPTLMDRIAELRVKVDSGTATDEELREALRMMREDRMTAGSRSAASKARKAPVDADQALKELFGL
jgi:hypothetical protein